MEMETEKFVEIVRVEDSIVANWSDEVFDFVFNGENKELAEKADKILDELGDFWNEIVDKNLKQSGGK